MVLKAKNPHKNCGCKNTPAPPPPCECMRASVQVDKIEFSEWSESKSVVIFCIVMAIIVIIKIAILEN